MQEQISERIEVAITEAGQLSKVLARRCGVGVVRCGADADAVGNAVNPDGRARSGRESKLVLWREPVLEKWIDYNGHLSEPYYVLVMGNATEAVINEVGMDPAYRAATGSSFYTVESHVRFLAEVCSHTELEVRSSVIGFNSKLAWFWHELWAEGRLRATEEVLGMHVTDRKSSPFPGDVAARLRDRLVDPPAEASRRIQLNP